METHPDVTHYPLVARRAEGSKRGMDPFSQLLDAFRGLQTVRFAEREWRSDAFGV